MKKLLTLIIFFCSSPQSYAETSVWKAEKGSTIVYLGGTIHLLHASDYPLPKEFEQAYKASATLTFETDISALSSPKMRQQVISVLNYNDKRTIANVTSAETYQALKKYASSNGVPLDYMKKAKPGMLMSTFLMIELQKMGITSGSGVEDFFEKLAQKDNKTLNYLETPKQQIDLIAEMGVGNEDKFYQYLIKDMQKMNTEFKKMVGFWRTGDSEKMADFVNKTMQKDFPKIYQNLLVKRNLNWIPTLEKYFTTKEIEFVLVGMAHLVGEDSVIDLLKKKGYKITKL